MKHSVKFFVGSIVVLVFFATTLFAVSKMMVSSSDYLIGLEVRDILVGDQNIKVFVAGTPSEQARGLSGVPVLVENTGMMFIFSESRIPEFWMKDMQFALDMIWIDETLTIVDIHQNVTPDTYPKTFSPVQPVSAVIEVTAGVIEKLGVGVGDVLILK